MSTSAIRPDFGRVTVIIVLSLLGVLVIIFLIGIGFFIFGSREDYENYQDLGEEKEFHFPSKHPSSRSPKPKSKQFKSHHQLVSVCAHCKCPISSSAIISGRMVADQQQQPPRFDNSSTYQKAMEIIYI
ncbi:uncharacterized protein LOC118435000 [Folsomia candida]|uniref:Uncharacterized protein n=1 Tax=Folsomia candida TaxID=158441 RepID=A0A226EIL9_FOLCA|nr:uncharacterized protein LOC118435000 [Folsomia candida]OXA56864.1 hypothetical protein Fcan01_07371 [Folsomia candida]